MPLDPKCRILLDVLSPPGARRLEESSVAEAREMMDRLAAMRAGGAVPSYPGTIRDREIPGPHGPIPVRVYAPESTGPHPLLAYFHGGGWVLGSVSTADVACRALAAATGCVLVSVDYRLAPEHEFPVPLDDCTAAVRWLAEHAAEVDADPTRIAVGGDSAGGNLSAAVALRLRDEGGPRLAHQLLVYPVTDASFGTRSYRENGEGYFLTRAGMEWFWGHYLPGPEQAANPLASPLRAPDLRGLPPATVITAEFDPLRDEGEAYAERLREAGVPTRLTRYDGVIHGFFGMVDTLDQADEAIREAAAALRASFGTAA
ncbi:alpha/beta hydrolase [bacterium]|nr:alpha/beta hydrolase [bacterium]